MTFRFEASRRGKQLSRAIGSFLDRLLDVPSQDRANTTTGVVHTDSILLNRYFEDPSRKRLDIYRDMEEIDETMPEGSRALDVLADNAVNAKSGSNVNFDIAYDTQPHVSVAKRELIDDMLERTAIREKAYGLVRDALKYGDCFLEIVVSDRRQIERLMFLPPASMKRNETPDGLLMMGRQEGTWAFEQHDPATQQFIAGFAPWQIEHMRWNRCGSSKYGTPALNSARTAWKKLQAMEEALVINWLTRAFARLLFELDTTGKSEKEAQVYVERFMNVLNKRNISATEKGIERLSVARDIAIGTSYQNLAGKHVPGLNKVSVLDTANTGFQNVTAIEYWRNKFIVSTGVPKAHLGLEHDVNSRATLEWQDARFVYTVRRVQTMMSETIKHLINLELLLHEIEPASVSYKVRWPNPAVSDDLSMSQVFLNYAKGAQLLSTLGLLDPEWLFVQQLGMSTEQFQQAKFNPPTSQQPIPNDEGKS